MPFLSSEVRGCRSKPSLIIWRVATPPEDFLNGVPPVPRVLALEGAQKSQGVVTGALLMRPLIENALMSACAFSFRSLVPDSPLGKTGGPKNGRLLEAAEAAGFHVILCATTNRLRDLDLLVQCALAAIGTIGSGDVVRI